MAPIPKFTYNKIWICIRGGFKISEDGCSIDAKFKVNLRFKFDGFDFYNQLRVWDPCQQVWKYFV